MFELQDTSHELEPPKAVTFVSIKPRWASEALCSKVPAEKVFPTDCAAVKAAKMVCTRCTVVEQCLENELGNEHSAGVWGGLSEPQRTLFRRQKFEPLMLHDKIAEVAAAVTASNSAFSTVELRATLGIS